MLKSCQATSNTNLRDSRIIGNIAGGSLAGALGLTSTNGALFYALVSLFVFLTMVAKTGGHPTKYMTGWLIMVTGALERQAILSYVLFWTLAYSFR